MSVTSLSFSSQELGYNSESDEPECRCPQHLPLHWPDTDRCYAEFSRGPCEPNQYLELGASGGSDVSEVRCVDTELCEPGSVFWPPEKVCHPLYTQVLSRDSIGMSKPSLWQLICKRSCYYP